MMYRMRHGTLYLDWFRGVVLGAQWFSSGWQVWLLALHLYWLADLED